MITEFEVKFYPIDKDKLRDQLKKLGAVLEIPERLMKRAIIDREFNPQLKCGFIRLRDEGGGVIRLSAKTQASQSGQVSNQKEIDVTVSDFAKTIEIINLMNLEFDSFIENRRETWRLDSAEIVIDTWPGLEPYIEIEAKSEKELISLAQTLSFDWDKKIITAAFEIYANVYDMTNEQVLDKLRKITFENTPFANYKKHPYNYSISA